MLRRLSLFAALAFGSLVGCGDDGGTTSGSGGSGDGGSSDGGGTGDGGASTTSTGGEGGEGGAPPQTHCEEICAFSAGVADDLGCPIVEGDCVVQCEQGFDDLLAGCDDEAIAFNDCLMAQDPEEFQCQPRGGITLSGADCDEQLNALVACQ